MKVVSVKYRSLRIGNMEDAELLTKAAESLQRIHIITGWDLPADAQYVKVLVEEFLEKLKDDFSNMNFDEIVYAFRKYGIGVKDWGKKMNLDLICGVLCEYLNEREQASMKEERANEMPVQKIYSADELLNLQRYDIECFYQRCRNGWIPPDNSIPHYFLEVMKADGFLDETATIDQVPLFFSYALGNGTECLYKKQVNVTYGKQI